MNHKLKPVFPSSICIAIFVLASWILPHSVSAQCGLDLVFVDACGTGTNECLGEYFVFTAQSDVNPDNIDFNVACPEPTIIRTANFTEPNTNGFVALMNSEYVNDCGGTDIFIDGTGMTIPAGSKVIAFFTPDPNPGLPAMLDFSPLCGGAPIYLIFGNHNCVQGAMLKNNDPCGGCGCIRYVTINIDGCSVGMNYDITQLHNGDGAYIYPGVDADNPEYEVSTGCLPISACSTPSLNSIDLGNICDYDAMSYDLTAHNQAVFASTTATYTWYDGNPESGGTAIADPTMADLTSITDLYIQVNEAGCGASIQVSFNIVTITLNSTSIERCADQATSFNLTSLNTSIYSGTGTIEYFDGDPDAGGVAISNLSMFDLTSLSNGLYVQVTESGCTGKLPIPVTVNPMPQGNISAPTKVCIGDCVDITWSITAGTPEYTLNLEVGVGPVIVPLENISSNGQNSGTIKLCVDNTTVIPTFDPSTNTVTLNGSVVPQITFKLENITDSKSCLTAINQTVNIDVFTPPSITDPGLINACLDASTGQAQITLSDYDDTVNGGAGGTVNWYADAAGTSAASNPLLVNSSTTVYAQLVDANCSSEIIPVDINVTSAPDLGVLDIPSPICGSFVLPEIPSTNTSINPQYYSGSEQTGNIYIPGEEISSNTTIYLYDGVGSCWSEQAYPINISSQPVIDPIGPIQECGSYTLPGITGSDIDNSYYYDATDPMITYTAGDVINTTINLFVFAESVDGCNSLAPLVIDIVNSIDIDPIDNKTVCNYLVLDDIQGTGVGNNAAYYTATNGAGTKYNVGDTIRNAVQLYAYEGQNGCEDEESFSIQIVVGPDIQQQDTVENCVSYTIPTINGSNLNTPAIYAAPNGQGNTWNIGDVLNQSGTYYVYDQATSGATVCEAQDSFYLEILANPDAGANVNTSLCATSIVDAFSLLPASTDISGTFVDPNNTGALSNSSLDLNKATGSTLDILYVLENSCGKDTAEVNISLLTKADAGADFSKALCSGGKVQLDTILNPDANQGGLFIDKQSGDTLSLVDVDELIAKNISLYYIVGDGVSCPYDTAAISLAYAKTPKIQFDQPLFACDSIALPVIQGTDLTGSEAYYTESGKMGTKYLPGDYIKQSTNLYAYDQVLYCFDEEEIQVQIGKTKQGNYAETRCSNNPITIGGVVFNPSNASQEVKFSAANGCDSLVQVKINFVKPDTTKIIQDLCFGQSITVNNKTYDSANPTGYESISRGGSLCDSTIFVQLSFTNAKEVDYSPQICIDQSLTINGNTYSVGNPQGQETFTLANGCDSIVNVALQFTKPDTNNISEQLCEGEELIVNNVVYNQANPSGYESIPLGNMLCDSVIAINLSFSTVNQGLVQGIYCDDEEIDTLGKTFTKDFNEAYITLKNASVNGCDSTVHVNFEFLPSKESIRSETLCQDETITIFGVEYSASNTIGQHIVQASNGCDSLINIDITIINFEPKIEIIPAGCAGEYGQVVLKDVNIDADAYFYSIDNGVPQKWKVGDTIQSILPGSHQLVITKGSSCPFTQQITIDKVEAPILSLPAEHTMKQGDSYQLNLTEPTGSSILWTPDVAISCTDCFNPSFSPTEDQLYIASLTDENGCTTSDSIWIRIKDDFKVYTPNIFTPNKDNLNERYMLFSSESMRYDMYVFDRWGNKVFAKKDMQTNDLNDGWDGTFNTKKAQAGIYVFYAEYYRTVNGVEVPKIVRGEFMLHR